MLAWSKPGKTEEIYSEDNVIRAKITQSGRVSDGTKRFRFSEGLDGQAFGSVTRADLEEAKEDAEEGVYLRAKVLIPRLVDYVQEYEQCRRRRNAKR
jgi:hypothetical protein